MNPHSKRPFRGQGSSALAILAATALWPAPAGATTPTGAPGPDDRAEPAPASGAVWFHGSDHADRVEGSDGDDLVHAYAGHDMLHGYAGDDRLDGFAGDDVLIGGTGNDELRGGSGQDRLVGGSGDDVLEGGEGDDVLEGGPGDDVYRFGERFGSDVIRERSNVEGGRDRIVFTALPYARARLDRDGDDLVVRDERSGDRVRVEGYYREAARRVETLEFNGEAQPAPAQRRPERLSQR